MLAILCVFALFGKVLAGFSLIIKKQKKVLEEKI
jgi:hypothetical protein